MEDWVVNLIVGVLGVICGFISGFLCKTVIVNNKQRIKGNNNKQIIGDIDNGDKK